MKQKILKYFTKFWMQIIFLSSLFWISLYFDTWMLFIIFLLILVSIVYQFVKRGIKRGFLSLLTFAIMIISISYIHFRDYIQGNVMFTKYSEMYEDKDNLQKIIGIALPDFEIVDSKGSQTNQFEFEFEVNTKLEFENIPSKDFFNKLDSIILIPIPEELDESSSYFYYGLESKYQCWSKEGNVYKYDRNTDFGEKFLHSKDAYFNLKISRGSKIAVLTYGNY